MLSLSFGKVAADRTHIVCLTCGEKGHAPSDHFSNPVPQIEEQPAEEEEEEPPLEVLPNPDNNGPKEDLVDDNGELVWQETLLEEAEEEDSMPALYEPKESMNRNNSDVLQTLEGPPLGGETAPEA